MTRQGAELIDLSNRTVLPGLIDAHVHLSVSREGNPYARRMTNTLFDTAYQTLPGYQAMLRAGFTTVRNVGDNTQVILALQRAVKKGLVEGPRMFVSGMPIRPTGGHYDSRNGIDPQLEHPSWDDEVADGADQVALRVRTLHREGVNLIKIQPSGGVTSDHDDPQQTLMTDEEISAAISTAHALGMKVAAHGHGTDAIERAARLGVDSIEHGTYIDDAGIAVMREKGTYLVPTLLVADQFLRRVREKPETVTPSVAAKVQQVAPLTNESAARAYKAGVKLAFGTDTSDGDNAKQFALLVAVGISPSDAILAATRNAADLLGRSQDVGTIQRGRYADIIAVPGDPLADISVMEEVDFVMKAGTVIVSTGVR
ncbi:metal-dependent hydrolase family protein [Aminobacter sp. HY435]|uniref:metal-dependent hydrolase family protein n=1 Tax=Aminobacter sp. HY435 TaxID=2970917 RepID=UPI0022B9624E|nr:amidohydrolase family protein [Aminobacter sp. HY435]